MQIVQTLPQLPSSAPLSPSGLLGVAALSSTLFLLLIRSSKNFLSAWCCVWSSAEFGVVADRGPGEAAEVLRPSRAAPAEGTERVDGAGRVAARLASFRDGSPATLMFRGFAVTAAEPSISVNARSTFGRLKLLLPMGPTMPAEAVSLGLRNAPRGSRLGFFAFSS